MNAKILATASAMLILAGQAVAQPPVVTNPSFELDDPTGNTVPLGWTEFNGALTVTTGISHTGSRSIKLSFGTSNFGAIWTSWPDTNNPTNPFPYDPLIIYRGAPITVSGWYMIPVASELQNGAFTTLKLEVRRTVNGSTYMQFEWPVFGHTNGQWTYFEHTITAGDFLVYPLEPTSGQPTRCTVMALIFGPNGVDPTSAVYWDDLNLVQAAATCYPNCDGSTSTPVLTANDFQCFLNAYASGLPSANCDGSTTTPVLTANDFQCFLNAYAGGCR